MATIVNRPFEYSYTRNPIRYKIAGTVGNFIDCRIVVTNQGTGTTTTTVASTLLVNANGEVFFYCEDLLDALVQWQLPDASNTNPQLLNNQIATYRLSYREYAQGASTPNYTVDSTVLIAVKGGVSYEKFSPADFFTNHLKNNFNWLTWLPQRSIVGFNENIIICALIQDTTANDITAVVSVNYVDGSAASFTITTNSTDTGIWAFNVGLFTSGISANVGFDTTKLVANYSVELFDGNTILCDGKIYEVDNRPFYNTCNFNYHNSLSGIDSIRILGDVDTELVRNYQEGEKIIASDYSNATALPAQFFQMAINEQLIYKGDAGWQIGKESQNVLRELLLSESVWELNAAKWWPLLITQKSTKLRNSMDTMWSFPVEWQYAFTNTNYTPTEAIISAAVAVCPIVSNLVTNYFGNNIYQIDFTTPTLPAIPNIYRVEFREKNTPFWSVVTNAPVIPFFQTLDHSKIWEWRLKSICDYSDSNYVNGADFGNEAMAFACPTITTFTLNNVDTFNGIVAFNVVLPAPYYEIGFNITPPIGLPFSATATVVNGIATLNLPNMLIGAYSITAFVICDYGFSSIGPDTAPILVSGVTPIYNNIALAENRNMPPRNYVVKLNGNIVMNGSIVRFSTVYGTTTFTPNYSITLEISNYGNVFLNGLLPTSSTANTATWNNLNFATIKIEMN